MADVAEQEAFPAGLKVLAVEENITCLRVLSFMLQKCRYQVTECKEHEEAMQLLRESKRRFDLVICNVSMPDMNGFKLIEHIGLKMDLPVIMVSADSRTERVMKGMKQGACDYLVKPVQMKEVQFIWKHAVRRNNNTGIYLEPSGSFEKNIMSERLPSKETPTGEDLSKKERFQWTRERHQLFVAVVKQLGIKHAVPRNILSMLNIPGLKREHVASHLQKYRRGLKKAEKKMQEQQVQLSPSTYGVGLNPRVGPTRSFGLQTLPARPVSWTHHAPNMGSCFLTPPSDNMLWQPVNPGKVPFHPARSVHFGNRDTLNHGIYNNNVLMGLGSGTSPALSVSSFNEGYNNGLYGTELMQKNNYSQSVLGMDGIELPTSNLTCGNAEELLNSNSVDLWSQL